MKKTPGLLRILILATLLLWRCSDNLAGSGGLETETKVYGYIHSDSNEPLANVAVSILYLDSQETHKPALIERVTTTNAEGHFNLTLYAQGRYLLKALHTDETVQSALHPFSISQEKELTLEPILLAGVGCISGTCNYRNEDTPFWVGVSVKLQGFPIDNQLVRTDSVFRFDNIPEGTYTLYFTPEGDTVAPIALSNVTVHADSCTLIEEVSFTSLEALHDHPAYIKDSLNTSSILVLNGIDLPVAAVSKVSSKSRIVELHLANMNITVLPEGIGALDALKKIDIRRNHLTGLPENITRLSGLRELLIDNNQLSTVPASIGQLDSLVTLGLSGNRLKSLPDSIGSLPALTELNLSDNMLAHIPLTIQGLDALQYLSLENNRLEALPPHMEGLVSLKSLTLQNNFLSNVPATITQLKNLQQLTVHNNVLDSLPTHIGDLKSLDMLWADNNNLHSLPVSISRCESLRFLLVSENQISSLPTEVGDLVNLREIDISYNWISTIPEACMNLPGLQKFSVSNNYLCQVTDSMRNWLMQYDSLYTLTQGCSDTAAPIVILEPKDGDVFIPGGELLVKWEINPSAGKPNLGIVISLTLDNGTTWTNILPGKPIQVSDQQWGEFKWKIPDSMYVDSDKGWQPTLTNQGAISIEDYTHTYRSAESEGVFSITGRGIEVTHPDGGEHFHIGDTVTVTWNTTVDEVTAVTCSLSIDSGQSWVAMFMDRRNITVSDSDWKQVTWIIPETILTNSGDIRNPVSENCLIKISDYLGCFYGGCTRDISNSSFRILQR